MSEERLPTPDPASNLAYIRLFRLFHPREDVDSEEAIANTRRMYQALLVYEVLSEDATQAGLTREEKDAMIMRGLRAVGRIDPTDPVHARDQYDIIRQGYEFDPRYWKPRLAEWREEQENRPR